MWKPQSILHLVLTFILTDLMASKMIGNSGRIRVCNNDGQEEKSECRALQVQVVPHLEELVACSIPRAPVRDVRR